MSRDWIRQLSTSDTPALESFVTLERRLLGSNPLFVSGTYWDVMKRLSGQSDFFSEMEYTLLAASREGQDVARCAALINHRYQRAKNEAVGFIGYFAAAPDSESQVQAMFAQAEMWLIERGVTRVIAPCNGAALLGAGLRTTAFDEEPVFPLRWHPPYYGEYLVKAGYKPAYPLWCYTVDFYSDKYRAAVKRADENKAVQVRPINKRRWDEDLETFRQILNETMKEEWEFYPHTSEEIHETFDPLKELQDPRQMLIAKLGRRPVGICWGIPDWTTSYRSQNSESGVARGSKSTVAKERYSRAGLLIIGVLPEHQGNGIGQALAVTLYRIYQAHGLKEAAYHYVNEINNRSRKFAESIGGTGRVLYHCYEKQLG